MRKWLVNNTSVYFFSSPGLLEHDFMKKTAREKRWSARVFRLECTRSQRPVDRGRPQCPVSYPDNNSASHLLRTLSSVVRVSVRFLDLASARLLKVWISPAVRHRILSSKMETTGIELISFTRRPSTQEPTSADRPRSDPPVAVQSNQGQGLDRSKTLKRLLGVLLVSGLILFGVALGLGLGLGQSHNDGSLENNQTTTTLWTGSVATTSTDMSTRTTAPPDLSIATLYISTSNFNSSATDRH